jgi:hypothetical protein
MAHTSISSTTKLYELQNDASIQHIVITHPKFREFSYQLSSFIQATKELSDEEFWTAPIKALKRYRFEMSVAPLGFGNKEIITAEIIEKLEHAVETSQIYYQNYSTGFGVLINNLKDLIKQNENPFLNQITEMLDDHPKLALVLKESRHIPVVEKILFHNGVEDSVKIISEAQLRKPQVIDSTIVCIGASRWYNDHMFRAPRSEEICVLRFNWIKDSDCRKTSVFPGSKKVTEVLTKRNPHYQPLKPLVNTSNNEVNVIDDDNWLEDEELIPSLNLSNVSRKFALEYETSDSTLGRLFQLEGRRGVFLEAEENSTTLVIDLDDEEKNRVHRATTNHIQTGMFVLLRADEGEGKDYIIPVADKILGNKAPQYRELQKSWKSKLRLIVNKIGFSETITRLKQYGSIRANEINIRNWFSEKSIRPADYKDFFAIMRLIRVEELAERWWNLASQIDKAHMLAGSRIRKQLLRQVLTSDLSELEQRGEMRFELAELGTKPLLALRVVRISEQATRISNNQVNKIFELEEDKWLG